MNVLIVTSPEYEDFIYHVIGEIDYREGLTFVINNKADFDRFVSSNSYDVGISFMWTHKIPKSEIDKATWINFHPGPLPWYKGRNLCYHAIMNGENEFGATVHYMDENFDTGDIIDMAYFPILKWYTAKDLSLYTLMVSKSQFREYLPRILAKEELVGLPNTSGNYYKKEPIDNFIRIAKYQERIIRAITYGEFYPKINIGGVVYKIVRDE